MLKFFNLDVILLVPFNRSLVNSKVECNEKQRAKLIQSKTKHINYFSFSCYQVIMLIRHLAFEW